MVRGEGMLFTAAPSPPHPAAPSLWNAVYFLLGFLVSGDLQSRERLVGAGLRFV